MKKIYLYITIFATISSFWACEIERRPFQDLPDDQVFSDELGIEAAALGTYALLKENELISSNEENIRKFLLSHLKILSHDLHSRQKRLMHPISF